MYVQLEDRRTNGPIAGSRWGAIRPTVVMAVWFGVLLFAASSSAASSSRSGLRSGLEGPAYPYASGHTLGYSSTRTTTEPYLACGRPTTGDGACLAIVVPRGVRAKRAPLTKSARDNSPAGPAFEGSGVEGGFSPSDLRSAYKIPATGGSSQTVAIVDAYNDPNAESDLNTYRAHYGIAACTAASGCFKKINQKGEEANYPSSPPAEDNWTVEEALDMDMISALCPECHIRLVEATNSELSNLYAAEDAAAAASGTTEISNSWGTPEYSGDTADNTYFDHPGIPITVSAGDVGYGAPEYPAASPDVISVGGTTLEKATNARGWEETVWADSGGGCSQYESPEEYWQVFRPFFCESRLDNDVAAVANPYSPVSVYASYDSPGWQVIGGTSVAAPIIAAIEAHASSGARAKGAEAFYMYKLFDVTAGQNGECGGDPVTMLCHAMPGYDGPTGWGTPDGPLETPVALSGPVTTGAFEPQGTGEVLLTGYVDPSGAETKYYFEYGRTTAYGASSGVGSVEEPGQVWESVTAKIAGLEPGQSYHYRLVATAGKSMFHGEDQTFTARQWTPQKMTEPYPFEREGKTYDGESRLRGVSCKAASECMAVGEAVDTYPKSEKEPDGWGPIAQKWNGKEWKLESVPLPIGERVHSGSLRGISCSATNACTAVGSAGPWILAERWSGTEWQIQGVPEESGTLNGVSCSSSKECVAVGGEGAAPLGGAGKAALWNGSSWLSETIAKVEGATNTELTGISCPAASMCIATGYYENKEVYDGSAPVVHPLTEEWNGTKWSRLSTPTAAGAVSTALEGISCTSTTACTAVGEYVSSWRTGLPLAERWSGSEKGWSVQAIQRPAGAEQGGLRGVTCASANECVAVGGHPTIVLHWNGTEWYPQSTLNPLAEEHTVQVPRSGQFADEESGTLLGVSCFSAAMCAGVGGNSAGPVEGSSGDFRELAENFEDPALPYVESEATGVSNSGATLVGRINPYGHETKYQFEYGTSISYGTTVPAGGASAGAGVENVEEKSTISGLTAGTTYHFRVVASDAAGTTYGTDHTFTALPEFDSTAAFPVAFSGERSGVHFESKTAKFECAKERETGEIANHVEVQKVSQTLEKCTMKALGENWECGTITTKSLKGVLGYINKVTKFAGLELEGEGEGQEPTWAELACTWEGLKSTTVIKGHLIGEIKSPLNESLSDFVVAYFQSHGGELFTSFEGGPSGRQLVLSPGIAESPEDLGVEGEDTLTMSKGSLTIKG
jgi:Subtilase family